MLYNKPSTLTRFIQKEDAVEIVCPDCHNQLTRNDTEALSCLGCGVSFPKRSSLDVLLSKTEWDSVLDLTKKHAQAHSVYLPARRCPLAKMYYDWWAARMWAKAPHSKVQVLELMCGGLELSHRMPSQVEQAVGLDINPMILEEALREMDNVQRQRIRLVCGTAARLPLPPESIDVVMIMGGLHHVRPFLPQVLTEISRVLKPNGLFIASEPANDHWLNRTIRRWQYKTSPLQGNDEGEDGFTREEIEKILGENRLKLKSYETFGFIAYPLLGNMDLLPLLTRSRNELLGQWLIQLDETLEKIPVIRRMSWASLFTALKPPLNEKN